MIEKEGVVLNERINLVYYVLPEEDEQQARELLVNAEDYLNFMQTTMDNTLG